MIYVVFTGFDYLPVQGKNKKFIWLAATDDATVVIQYICDKVQRNIYVDTSLDKFVQPLNSQQFTFFNIAKSTDFRKTNEFNSNKKICLYAQSDTLAKSVHKLYSALNIENVQVFTPKYSTENANEYFRKKGIPFETYNYSRLKKSKPKILLLLNDWSKEAQRIISHCRLLKIPTVCLQESIIDFGDSFKRMQHTDYVFIQGSRTIFDLNRNIYFLTGNPRYEIDNKQSKNLKQKVLINCNFTYNIYEEIRNDWLNQTINVVEKNNIEYEIIQHPRDTGDLSKYKNVIRSSASTIDSKIEESTIIITRFSSLAHEALLQNKSVIYYNPHGEKLQYDFEFNNEFIMLAHNTEELNACLLNLLHSEQNTNDIKKYLINHCIPKEKKPTKIISELLENLNLQTKKFGVTDLYALIVYHPLVKRVLLSIFRKNR